MYAHIEWTKVSIRTSVSFGAMYTLLHFLYHAIMYTLHQIGIVLERGLCDTGSLCFMKRQLCFNRIDYNVSGAMVLMNITNAPNIKSGIWPSHTQTYYIRIPGGGQWSIHSFKRFPGDFSGPPRLWDTSWAENDWVTITFFQLDMLEMGFFQQ